MTGDEPWVLVTGASGFVGRTLCRRLQASGYRVRGVYRASTQDRDTLDAVELRDFSNPREWRAHLQNVSCVVHLAAKTHSPEGDDEQTYRQYRDINVEATRALLTACESHDVRRFVYLSSVKVNGESTTTGTCPRYCSTDEPRPLGPYGETKLAAERLIAEASSASNMRSIVLRAPLIYGAGQKGNMRKLVNWVRKGIPLPLALVANQRSLIYVENLCDAIQTILSSASTIDGVFTIADVELSTPALIQAIAASANLKARLLPFPPSLLLLAARLVGQGAAAERLVGSLLVDSEAFGKAFDWTPPVSFQDAMANTVGEV